MSDLWLQPGIGVRIAGLAYAAVLVGTCLVRLRPWSRTLVPTLYFLCVAAAVAKPPDPLADAAVLRVLGWTGGAILPAAAFLFVSQLATGGLPSRTHFLVLGLPATILPIVYAGALIGDGRVCPEWLATCAPLGPLVTLLMVVVGAVVLLMLVMLLREYGGALAAGPQGRERRALALSIVALNTGILAIAFGGVAGFFRTAASELAAAVIQVTLLYLAGAALFRLQPAVASGAGASALASEPIDGSPSAAPGAAQRLDQVAREGGTDPVAPSAIAADPDQQALLDRLRGLLEDRKAYREAGLSRRALADALGVPEYRLTRVVNEGLGLSVTDLINAHRVDDACERLRAGRESVTEICFGVGFNSLAAFNRAFRARTGTTPTEFRRAAAAAGPRATEPPGADGDRRSPLAAGPSGDGEQTR